MVIDLTRRPIVINTDVCQDSIVIRTAGAGTVDGLLRRRLEKREQPIRNVEKQQAADMCEVVPTVSLPRGGVTLREVRLPMRHVFARGERKGIPFPNPYEVATYFKDSLVGAQGTWRIEIKLEKVVNNNGTFWTATFRDLAAGMDLATATTKSLDFDNTLHSKLEPLPLERVLAKTGENTPLKPTSVWDRLRGSADPLTLDDESL